MLDELKTYSFTKELPPQLDPCNFLNSNIISILAAVAKCWRKYSTNSLVHYDLKLSYANLLVNIQSMSFL